MRKLLRDLRRAVPQARIEITGKQHIRLVLPNGRSVIVAGTPSCRGTIRIALADVRRQMAK
jgi:hypothetical protein